MGWIRAFGDARSDGGAAGLKANRRSLHPEDWRPNPVSNHLLKGEGFLCPDRHRRSLAVGTRNLLTLPSQKSNIRLGWPLAIAELSEWTLPLKKGDLFQRQRR